MAASGDQGVWWVRPVWIGMVALSTACFGSKFQPGSPGDECAQIEECGQGLTCAHDGVCRFEDEPGTTPLGGACSANTECRIDLVCSRTGTCEEQGTAGTAGFGATCSVDDDCQLGLSCGESGTCLGFQVPFWTGGACPDPEEDETPFRIRWTVSGQAPDPFYSHPFPDDSRRAADGSVDMSTHVTPGPLIELLGDVPRKIADELGAGLTADGLSGAGPNQAIFLRFSSYPESSSLKFGIPGLTDGSIAVVDLSDENAAEVLHPFGYEINSGRSAYICHHWMSVYPTDGRPFIPGHTYALLLGNTIRSDDDGSTLSRTADFEAMLATTAPSDARLSAAWDAYAPLRTWMGAVSVDPAAIGAAAVFTVQDVEARPQAVFEAVQAATLPALTDAADCAESDPFAVAGDDTRGCASSNAPFVEIQGVLDLPAFQTGTPPFKNLEDGGGIPVVNGAVSPVGTHTVQVTLTLPIGTAPAEGWPLVIYGHGTNGSYTSGVRTGVSSALSGFDVGDDTVAFATLGFDAPMHGPRAFPENHDPAWLEVDPHAYDADVLFFNPINPRAARDNVLQQAADLWTLTRWADEIGVAAEDSPTGEAIAFDPANLYYLGHSQGGVVGTLYAAYEPRVRAIALSGAGGLTIRSLLGKTSPNDLPAAIRVALADPAIDRVHPLLNIAQALADGSDGVNFGRRVQVLPFEGNDPKHVLMIDGVGDTYTPDSTTYALARGLALQQMVNGNPEFDLLTVLQPPVKGNASRGMTGVVSRYANAGDDAHFVLFDRPEVMVTMARYFATAVLDEQPTVE